MFDPHAREDLPERARGAIEVRQSATLERMFATLLTTSGAAIGVDVVHIPTWATIRKRAGAALDRSVYTERELQFAGGRPERLAARLAGKEAALKALGTG